MNENMTDNETLELVNSIFMEKIPFNNILGLTIDTLTFDDVCLKFMMKEELIGNYLRGSLHGGVISSFLDVTGGLVAFLSVLKEMREEPRRQKMEKLGRLGTIDLRIDYLLPGTGTYFLSRGFILRKGNKVAVTRMELHNNEKKLVAVGTGAFMVG